MTNEEEREWKFFLHQARMKFSRVTPGGDIAHQLCDLAERLLKENSELRVRDSNVTAHSLNVLAVNEDLMGRKCGTCKHWQDKTCKAVKDRPQQGGELASVASEYGVYETALYTEANFGCVLWEKKP